MLKSESIVAFAATTNPSRAKRFYGKTLGLRFVSADPFAVVFDAGGTTLRVAVVPKVARAEYTMLGWSVKDIERTVRGLKRRGVKFQRYAGMGQDKLAIWTSPSGAKVAWFLDPDGNVLSVTQMPRARRRSS